MALKGMCVEVSTGVPCVVTCMSNLGARQRGSGYQHCGGHIRAQELLRISKNQQARCTRSNVKGS